MAEPEWQVTTDLINAIGHTPVTFTRARIDTFGGDEISRVDVAPSPRPVRAATSEADSFFVRMNNSTRQLPDVEIDSYVATHWSEPRALPIEG